jgi:hypothetical protein
MAWDMAQPDHRQHNPFNALRQARPLHPALLNPSCLEPLSVPRGYSQCAVWDATRAPGARLTAPHGPLPPQSARFVEEAVGTLGRRVNNGPKGVWLGRGKMGYPAYYMNNFHYQGDGWMSTKCAPQRRGPLCVCVSLYLCTCVPVYLRICVSVSLCLCVCVCVCALC